MSRWNGEGIESHRVSLGGRRQERLRSSLCEDSKIHAGKALLEYFVTDCGFETRYTER